MKKYKILFLLFIFIAFSCENNFQEENQVFSNDTDFVLKIVSLENIPEIKSFLNLESSNNNLKKSSDDFSLAIIDETSIIQTIDRENNVNYTLSYIYEDSPENVFYNLVVNVLPSGEKKAYIFKYISNLDDFRFFRDSNYNFDYFKGETEMSFYDGDLNKIHSFNRDGADDEPCPKVYIPSPDYSGTGPLNNVVPSGSGGGPGQVGPGGFNTTVMGYNYYAGSNGVISVSWGGNTTYTGGGTSSSNGGGNVGTMDPAGPIYFYHFTPWKNQHEQKSSTMSKSGDCEDTVPPTGNPAVNQSQSQLL